MITFKADGGWTKGDSKKNPCKYAVYEFAPGGNLFEFVVLGALPENMARMYFKQLIEGISYLHKEVSVG